MVGKEGRRNSLFKERESKKEFRTSTGKFVKNETRKMDWDVNSYKVIKKKNHNSFHYNTSASVTGTINMNNTIAYIL